MRTNIYGLNEEELNLVVEKYNQPKFRSKQILAWIYKGITSFEQMRNIPKELMAKLEEDYEIFHLELIKKLVEGKSNTTKFLFKTKDGLLVESVLLRYDSGCSICISTQAGCRMGCVFCASGKDGLIRNLTKGEMLSQIQEAQRLENQKINNIVLMGSGEPLDNYDEVIKFIRLVGHKDALNIGQRHITLSTCGVVPKIYDLCDEDLNINLSISLHSPIHKERLKIMPIEKAYNVDQLIKACKYYREKTKRRVTFEYCLIPGENDGINSINSLDKILKGTDFLLNVIGVNEGENNVSCSPKQIEQFADEIKAKGHNVTIRRKLGSSINAACGQLKSGYVKEV